MIGIVVTKHDELCITMVILSIIKPVVSNYMYVSNYTFIIFIFKHKCLTTIHIIGSLISEYIFYDRVNFY